MKPFSRRIACLVCAILSLASCLVFAAETKLAPGTWRGTAVVTILVDAAGNQTVTVDPAMPLTITGGGGVVPVPPGPVVPIPPGTLTEAVKAATAAVPAYADKATHQRSMAFGMTFLAKATGNTPVANARATVRQFCDAAVGADAPKWAAWWGAIDAKLNAANLTPATYTAALQEIASALTVDLPATANAEKDSQGNQSFGLDPELIKFLLTVLLPLLLKLLGLGSLFLAFPGLA